MMAKIVFPDFVAVPNQIQVQRQNFISVCRLVVKTLTDNINVLPIDEGSQDLQNLFAILEQIFSHRLKPIISWYGGQEPRHFWDFIKEACAKLPRNCLATVESMSQPKTSIGKGRAWIRMCLMEKRLSDYVRVALQSLTTLETFFEEGSIMLCEESSILPDILLGLNIIDFSFDIKGTYLDFPWFLAINYSKYLKFNNQSNQVSQPIKDHRESGEPSGSNEYLNEADRLNEMSNKLTEQLKVTTEQKRYLDELLRLRELQIEDLTVERKKAAEAVKADKLEKEKEKSQFESIIFELQSQLFYLREYNKGLSKRLQISHAKEENGGRTHRSVLMSHLLTRENQEILPGSESETREQTSTCIEAHVEIVHPTRESYSDVIDEEQSFDDKEDIIKVDADTVETKLEKANLEQIIKT